MEEKNYFEQLNSVDVGEHIEKKNGLSYLSWVWAWAEVKKRFPDANFKVYEREDGCIYWTDGRTCWVKTGVILNGIEHIDHLPVMDYRNKSIPIENITSIDVNKAIKRSLTKSCALHGLGLYVYAGEDLPEADANKKSTEISQTPATKDNQSGGTKKTPTKGELLDEMYRELKRTGIGKNSILKAHAVKSENDLTIGQLEVINVQLYGKPDKPKPAEAPKQEAKQNYNPGFQSATPEGADEGLPWN